MDLATRVLRRISNCDLRPATCDTINTSQQAMTHRPSRRHGVPAPGRCCVLNELRTALHTTAPRSGVHCTTAPKPAHYAPCTTLYESFQYNAVFSFQFSVFSLRFRFRFSLFAFAWSRLLNTRSTRGCSQCSSCCISSIHTVIKHQSIQATTIPTTLWRRDVAALLWGSQEKLIGISFLREFRRPVSGNQYEACASGTYSLEQYTRSYSSWVTKR